MTTATVRSETTAFSQPARHEGHHVHHHDDGYGEHDDDDDDDEHDDDADAERAVVTILSRRGVAVGPDELQDLIEQLRSAGTDLVDVEAKRSGKALPKTTRETLSAFQNTVGGTLILGLDEADGFRAVGVDDAPKVASDLASLCSDNMEPPVRPLIHICDYQSVQLVVAEVPALEPNRRPSYYKGAGMTRGSYVRVHDGDHQLSAYEVQLMVASRGQPVDDLQPVTEASISHLDPELTLGFVDRLRRNRPYAFADQDEEQMLRRARVTIEYDGRTVPTVAGLLSLGSYPQEFMPQMMLTFVHYPTVTGPAEGGARFLDNIALEGPIPLMVRDAMAVLRRNMSRRSFVSGAGRSDNWEYPETALREAIVNALVHRDVSPASRGAQVQVEMYPDRLVIRNPGGLFGPVSLSDLGEDGISSSRNATLLRILEDVPIPGEDRAVCENRGSGIRAMRKSLISAGMSVPEFRDVISSFHVTFPNHALLSDEVVSWIRGLGEDGLTSSQVLGLAMMRDGRVIDNATYRAATDIDSRVATSELQDLVARELVRQAGTRRWATYRLLDAVRGERAATSPERKRTPADRRGEVLDALGDGDRSRAEIARATGLSDQVVSRWLRILRQAGQVELVGATSLQSKNARYRRISGAAPEYSQDSLELSE